MAEKIEIKTYSHADWKDVYFLNSYIFLQDSYLDYYRKVVGITVNSDLGVIVEDDFETKLRIKRNSIELVHLLTAIGANKEDAFSLYINDKYIHSFGDEAEANKVYEAVLNWAFQSNA